MAVSTKHAASTGYADVNTHDEHCLEVSFGGHVTGAVLRALVPRVERALAQRGEQRVVLFDALGVQSYDLDLREPAAELLRVLRAGGVRRASAACALPAVRMIGSALTLAAGLPTRFFATRGEAVGALDELRREASR